MSECLNAGTGCGWCIPILKKIHDSVQAAPAVPDETAIAGLPDTPAEYEAARKSYLKSDSKNEF